MFCCTFFFFKQKTAYDMRISDWSSDVCSSDLPARQIALPHLHISGKHGPVLPVLHLDAVGVHIHRLLAVMTLQHGNGLPHGGRRQGKEKAGNQQSRTERAERRNVHDAVHLTLFWTICKRARPSNGTGRSPLRSEGRSE